MPDEPEATRLNPGEKWRPDATFDLNLKLAWGAAQERGYAQGCGRQRLEGRGHIHQRATAGVRCSGRRSRGARLPRRVARGNTRHRVSPLRW